MARTAAIAGTATAVSGGVRRRQESRWAQKEQAQVEPQAAPAPVAASAAPAAAPAGQSTIDQLKELAELKSQGILTEDEFAAQKAKILGS
jgi:hypothetical protein